MTPGTGGAGAPADQEAEIARLQVRPDELGIRRVPAPDTIEGYGMTSLRGTEARGPVGGYCPLA